MILNMEISNAIFQASDRKNKSKISKKAAINYACETFFFVETLSTVSSPFNWFKFIYLLLINDPIVWRHQFAPGLCTVCYFISRCGSVSKFSFLKRNRNEQQKVLKMQSIAAFWRRSVEYFFLSKLSFLSWQNCWKISDRFGCSFRVSLTRRRASSVGC